MKVRGPVDCWQPWPELALVALVEAGLASALEEKRGLLERLMASEAETERTRNMTVELRRKLDDAQAALHELGRENQSIQVCRLVS